jgi:hypothetical protein
LSAVLAWRAAKTRIYRRQVALLLLQFAAAGLIGRLGGRTSDVIIWC